MPSSKLNPPATFNFWRPPRTNSTRGVQKRFSGVSRTVPGEARACAWLHGAARPCHLLQRQPRRRVLDGSPAAPGRRHGPFGPTARGRQLAARNAGTVILCMYVAAAAAAAAPGVMCQQSCTRADLLLDDDGAPRRRSIESGERVTEREREPGPPRRRRAAVSHAMAVSARRALWRTGFGFPCCRVGACAEGRLAFYFARPSGARRRIVPTRPPATARYV